MLECHCLLLHGLSETGRNVDALAFGQSNDRFLDVALAPDKAAEPLDLTLAHCSVDCGNLDAEQRFDCSLDFRLRCLAGYVEDNWLCSETMVDFSVITGLTITS